MTFRPRKGGEPSARHRWEKRLGEERGSNCELEQKATTDHPDQGEKKKGDIIVSTE